MVLQRLWVFQYADGFIELLHWLAKGMLANEKQTQDNYGTITNVWHKTECLQIEL